MIAWSKRGTSCIISLKIGWKLFKLDLLFIQAPRDINYIKGINFSGHRLDVIITGDQNTHRMATRILSQITYLDVSIYYVPNRSIRSTSSIFKLFADIKRAKNLLLRSKYNKAYIFSIWQDYVPFAILPYLNVDEINLIDVYSTLKYDSKKTTSVREAVQFFILRFLGIPAEHIGFSKSNYGGFLARLENFNIMNLEPAKLKKIMYFHGVLFVDSGELDSNNFSYLNFHVKTLIEHLRDLKVEVRVKPHPRYQLSSVFKQAELLTFGHDVYFEEIDFSKTSIVIGITSASLKQSNSNYDIISLLDIDDCRKNYDLVKHYRAYLEEDSSQKYSKITFVKSIDQIVEIISHNF